MRREFIIIGLTAVLCSMFSGCCCCLNFGAKDALDETVPELTVPVETEPVAEPTEPPTEYIEPTYPPVEYSAAGMILDPHKAYSMSWVDSDGVNWFARYHFLADGSCTMILGCGYEVYSTGAGRYRVDGNELHFSLWVDGITYLQYGYRFDPYTQMLEQITQEGFAFYHEMGDRFPFYVDTSESY